MDFEGFNTLIDGLGDGEKNTAAKVRALFRHLIQSIYLPGDIKMVICTPEDLASDYTPTGLGIGKRAGWAICNGLNGTEPFGGRVPLAYGDDYPNIGQRDGSKDAVVVEHTHNTWGFGPLGSGSDGLASNSFKWGLINKTSKEGVSGTDKNLPPYIVTLFIMKL